MTDSIRLAKRLASMLPCSRSEAEKFITSGFVTVDGEIVEEPGFRVADTQNIVLMPDAKLSDTEAVTILLHKPAGINIHTDIDSVLKLLTPDKHSVEDRSGIRFIKRHFKDLVLLDPLGINASGLQVLTQDWHISRKLSKDAARVEQEYIVEVTGELIPDGIKMLNQGIPLQGKLYPVKVSWQNESRLRFAFKGVQRRHMEELCNSVGLSVTSMKRIRIGRVPMAALQPGQWRYLSEYEKF